jgi:hypothetical protein
MSTDNSAFLIGICCPNILKAKLLNSKHVAVLANSISEKALQKKWYNVVPLINLLLYNAIPKEAEKFPELKAITLNTDAAISNLAKLTEEYKAYVDEFYSRKAQFDEQTNAWIMTRYNFAVAKERMAHWRFTPTLKPVIVKIYEKMYRITNDPDFEFAKFSAKGNNKRDLENLEKLDKEIVKAVGEIETLLVTPTEIDDEEDNWKEIEEFMATFSKGEEERDKMFARLQKYLENLKKKADKNSDKRKKFEEKALGVGTTISGVRQIKYKVLLDYMSKDADLKNLRSGRMKIMGKLMSVLKRNYSPLLTLKANGKESAFDLNKYFEQEGFTENEVLKIGEDYIRTKNKFTYDTIKADSDSFKTDQKFFDPTLTFRKIIDIIEEQNKTILSEKEGDEIRPMIRAYVWIRYFINSVSSMQNYRLMDMFSEITKKGGVPARKKDSSG